MLPDKKHRNAVIGRYIPGHAASAKEMEVLARRPVTCDEVIFNALLIVTTFVKPALKLRHAAAQITIEKSSLSCKARLLTSLLNFKWGAAWLRGGGGGEITVDEVLLYAILLLLLCLLLHIKKCVWFCVCMCVINGQLHVQPQ